MRPLFRRQFNLRSRKWPDFFEAQFRTIKSYGLKSANHKEYEEYRDSATSDDRKCELFKTMAATHNSLLIPKDMLGTDSLIGQAVTTYSPPGNCSIACNYMLRLCPPGMSSAFISLTSINKKHKPPSLQRTTLIVRKVEDHRRPL